MSSFPIANMLRQGAPMSTPFNWASGTVAEEKAIAASILAKAVFFDASIPSTLFWQGARDNYSDSLEDLGPIRPSYPVMWMEWEIPDQVQLSGKWHDFRSMAAHPSKLHWAAAITTADGEQPERWPEGDHLDRWNNPHAVEVGLTLFEMNADWVCVIPITKRILIDARTGRYISGTSTCMMPESAMKTDPETAEDIQQWNNTHSNVVWMALQLINCRNVITRQTGSVFTRSGVDKRRGVPITRYHTIVLPGTGGSSGNGHRNPKQDIMALHQVRGHFKTFTAEKPLLGKHVGTYWWGWNVRGDADNGIVVSDYKLKGEAS